MNDDELRMVKKGLLRVMGKAKKDMARTPNFVPEEGRLNASEHKLNIAKSALKKVEKELKRRHSSNPS
jgi:hypothetical protein